MPSISGSVGRGGNNSYADVVIIQNRLNSHRTVIAPQAALVVDGSSGTKTIAAIKRFQNLVCGFSNPDGRVDPGGTTEGRLNGGTVVAGQGGLVGPGSMISEDSSAADLAAAQGSTPYDYRAGPQADLADIALPFIGARETGNNRHGNEARMMEIFAADSLDGDGYAWCCSFVSLCTQKLFDRKRTLYGHLPKPREAKVYWYRDNWATPNNCRVIGPNDFNAQPHKGDVVIYDFSHIGIIESVHQNHAICIEGNTNTTGSREGVEICRQTRPWRRIKNVIRFPVAIQAAEEVPPPTFNYDWSPATFGFAY